jgi:predicted DNA-binding protein
MSTNERTNADSKKPTFSIRIAPELKERMRAVAKRSRHSLNVEIEIAIEEWCSRMEGELENGGDKVRTKTPKKTPKARKQAPSFEERLLMERSGGAGPDDGKE